MVKTYLGQFNDSHCKNQTKHAKLMYGGQPVCEYESL